MSTEAFKRLGASSPAATTATALYTCPADKTAVLDGITVVNRSTSGTFRIAHVNGAIGDVADEDYVYYDYTLADKATLTGLLKGRAMSGGDTILIYVSANTFSFTVGGVEMSSAPLPYYSAVNKTATGSLSATECINTLIDNYGQGAAMTLTLPTAAAGYYCIVAVVTTGYAIYIKAGASDKIYLDGTALDDADKVGISSPALGDCIQFMTYRTGASSYDWMASSGVGLWVDSGA